MRERAVQRKRSRAPVALVIVGLSLVIALVGIFVIVPRVVARKVTEAGEKRALTIQYGASSWKLTRAELTDVAITPKGSRAVVITAKSVDARLAGLSPSYVIIPAADVQIAGPFDSVLRAIDPVRKADEVLPASERLPIDVTTGTVRWTRPFGDESALSFGSLATWIRPPSPTAESRMQVRLGKGKVELPQVVIEPLAVDVTRTTTKGERIDLIATLGGGDGSARLEAHRTTGAEGSALDAELTFDALGLATLSSKLPGLDLEKAVLEGDVTAARSEAGEVSSRGKLVLTKIRLPPVVVGPVSAAIGGTVRVTWKGSPKKGAPGTMKIDDGRIEVTLGGKARVVRISGEVSVGKEAEGPFLIALDWEVGPLSCSEIAGDLAAGMGGGLVKGLASGAVSGNVMARGKVKGDLAALDDVKKTLEVQEACKIEIDFAKGAGDLLKKLPF